MELEPHGEHDLKQCTASELFIGAIFWIKQDNGEFHKASVTPPLNPMAKERYKAGLKKFSQEGRLWTRRDKPFKHFWE